jgi:hypothetical protein
MSEYKVEQFDDGSRYEWIGEGGGEEDAVIVWQLVGDGPPCPCCGDRLSRALAVVLLGLNQEGVAYHLVPLSPADAALIYWHNSAGATRFQIHGSHDHLGDNAKPPLRRRRPLCPLLSIRCRLSPVRPVHRL